MRTPPPPNGEPHARGSVIHGFRSAVVDVGGQGALRDLADRLPLESRAATMDGIVLPFEWVALKHVMAWHEVLWNGLAQGDESNLSRFVGRSIELGIARFKSAFFASITPPRLVERAPELWRWQHTHGELCAHADDEEGGTLTLTDHPYVECAASRRVMAESYKHMVLRSGGSDVRVAWSALPRGHGHPYAPAHAPHLAMRVAPAAGSIGGAPASLDSVGTEGQGGGAQEAREGRAEVTPTASSPPAGALPATATAGSASSGASAVLVMRLSWHRRRTLDQPRDAREPHRPGSQT